MKEEQFYRLNGTNKDENKKHFFSSEKIKKKSGINGNKHIKEKTKIRKKEGNERRKKN